MPYNPFYLGTEESTESRMAQPHLSCPEECLSDPCPANNTEHYESLR